MSDNPYQAPEEQQVVGVNSGKREDLRKVATAQKGVLICLLIQIGLFICSAQPNTLLTQSIANIASPVQIAMLIVGLAGAVFVFLLASRTYGIGLAILFTVVPCLNLLILLMINQKATQTLTSNGIKVGFMGAKTTI